MVAWSGLYSAYRAARYVATAHIKGDIVECGVWRGGCSIIMAETLAGCGVTETKIYMYDTFEGMSEPTDKDFHIQTKEPATALLRSSPKSHPIWAISHLAEVRKNIASAAYPERNFVIIKGRVEDTIPASLPEKIAILRLDTDWYGSTRHELIHLFPRLVRGGVLICDDYGVWAGARKALDEYLADNGIALLLNSDAINGAVTAIKT